MHGYRLNILGVSMVIAVGAEFIVAPAWRVVVVFAVFFGVVGPPLAWVGSRRDDAGLWSNSAVAAELMSLAQVARIRLIQLARATPAMRMVDAGRLGMLVGGAEETLRAAENAVLFRQGMPGIGLLFLLAGALLAAVGRKHLPRRRARPRYFSRQRPYGTASLKLRGVPEIVTAAQAREALGECGVRVHGDIQELLQVLEALDSWRPRPKPWWSERHYELALLEHMMRRLADLLPETQPCLWHGKSYRRADLVVGDVLIELKCRYERSSRERIMSQLHDYTRLWRQGPILLVLCGHLDEEVRDDLGAKLRSLRGEEGHPILGVVAR